LMAKGQHQRDKGTPARKESGSILTETPSELPPGASNQKREVVPKTRLPPREKQRPKGERFRGVIPWCKRVSNPHAPYRINVKLFHQEPNGWGWRVQKDAARKKGISLQESKGKWPVKKGKQSGGKGRLGQI